MCEKERQQKVLYDDFELKVFHWYIYVAIKESCYENILSFSLRNYHAINIKYDILLI